MRTSRVSLWTSVLVVCCTLAGAALPASASTGLIGQWKFNGDFTNSGSSGMKMEALDAGGTGSFQTVDVNGTNKTAWVFTAPEGLTLSKIPLANRKTFSIDVYFELNDVSGYKRILSFGPNTKDEALYFDNGMVNLYDVRRGSDVMAPNEWTHVVVTRQRSTGLMTVYMDGVRQFKYRDGPGDYWLRKGKVVFFKDNFFGPEDSSGTVSLIRFYDHVIAPD